MKTLALSDTTLETIQDALLFRLAELDKRKEELVGIGATDLAEEEAQMQDVKQALRDVRRTPVA